VADGQGDRCQRRRVVQRGGGQVGEPLPVPPQSAEEADHGEHLTGRDIIQGTQDALGPAGRARGVEHRRTQALVGYRRVREGAGRRFEVGEQAVVSGAVDDQAGPQPRAVARRLDGHIPARPGGDQELGGAVVEDVGQLRCGQVGVDARVVQAGPLPGTAGLQVPVVVLHENGVVIQAAQPPRAQQVSQPVGPRLVLGVRNGFTGRGHDECGLIGALTSMRAWVHPIPLRGARSSPPRRPGAAGRRERPGATARAPPESSRRQYAAQSAIARRRRT
jgi:hypothetical protein